MPLEALASGVFPLYFIYVRSKLSMRICYSFRKDPKRILRNPAPQASHLSSISCWWKRVHEREHSGRRGRHRSWAACCMLCLHGHLPAAQRAETHTTSISTPPPFYQLVQMGLRRTPRKLTNGSLGRMESKETVFLPFPCISGVRAELLF